MKTEAGLSSEMAYCTILKGTQRTDDEKLLQIGASRSHDGCCHLDC